MVNLTYGDLVSAEVEAFILLVEQYSVVKEVSLCLYRMYCSHLPSTNHVNADLYIALCIVTTFGRLMAIRYGAQFCLSMPLEAPQLRQTLQMVPPTSFSDQA